jgi:hypothetical protein
MLKNHKDHYTPTRLCPHRYCRIMHGAMAASVVLLLCSSTSIGLSGLVWLVVSCVAAYVLIRLVNGKGVTGLLAEEAETRGTLIARPGWARAALAWDGVFFASGLFVAYWQLRGVKPASTPALTAGGLTELAFAAALTLFGPFAHLLATRRARPSRVPVQSPSS